MNDAKAMHLRQAACGLSQQRQGLFRADTARASARAGCRREIFHCQVARSTAAAMLDHAHHVLMPDGRQDVALRREALPDHFALAARGLEKLQGDIAAAPQSSASRRWRRGPRR